MNHNKSFPYPGLQTFGVEQTDNDQQKKDDYRKVDA